MSCCRRRRRRGLLFQWFPLSPLPPLPSPFRTGRSGPAGFARRWRPSRMLSTKRTAQTAVSVVVTSLMSTTTAITNTNQFFFLLFFTKFRSTPRGRSIIGNGILLQDSEILANSPTNMDCVVPSFFSLSLSCCYPI
jgi:hypothetical protein